MMPGIVSAPLAAAAQGMEAIATPSSVSKTVGRRSGGATVNTPSTTVTVTGGTAPYTHSWATTDSIATAASPTAATTTFQASLGLDESDFAVFIDTVTDANGVVTTAECDASMSVVGI